MKTRIGQYVRFGLFLFALAVFATRLVAAPYAALVMDMRTGEVIHARNADTQLHPASLTKMMTLYIAFEAIEHGEISLDTMVTISANAAAEPPSKLGLRKGQKIALRYLIRAAAVKSANDAATAIGEAIAGSEAAFARRMNRTAAALGMTRTHFKNANGLTEAGHMSTARDMTTLGRHLFFDYPEYYNLFSRRTADVGGREVANTNTRFLNAYRGADGIKTGYTSAAGFNLVASAERDGKRIIAAVFGGQSTAARNSQMAELLDMGFRKVPTRVATRAPGKPRYEGPGSAVAVASAGDVDDKAVDDAAVDAAVAAAVAAGIAPPAGKVIRIVTAPSTSIRPQPRPGSVEAPPEAVIAALEEGIDDVVQGLLAETAEPEAAATPAPRPEDLAGAEPAPEPEPQAALDGTLDGADPVTLAEAEPPLALPAPEPAPSAVIAVAAPVAAPPPGPRPEGIILAAVEPASSATVEQEVITRMSTSGGRHWGINIGRYRSQYEAESVLLKTALVEISTLGEALRKVANSSQGFEANFVGLTQEGADLACRRLAARAMDCQVIGPPS